MLQTNISHNGISLSIKLAKEVFQRKEYNEENVEIRFNNFLNDLDRVTEEIWIRK